MREYLICVDSDGCAMDTMTIKHVKCFGPDIIAEWGLQEWEEPILKRWNDINLYTKNRGINRFSGLTLMLEEIDKRYTKIDGIEILRAWVDHTKAFSESALKEEIEKQPDAMILKKALSWSQAVNRDITALSDDVKIAFPKVAEALAAVKEVADLAIVSSANREAMEEEWERCGIMQYVDYSMAQDVGTKAACIEKLKESGYNPKNILMVGDADGDYKAAVKAGVYFYPILAGKEEESWIEFKDKILGIHVAGGYDEKLQQEMLDRFNENLAD